ncbi:MAG: hypothetical protein UT66_C0012G0016 [candidate division CPR2 bacterium GW2011_GWC1_39_9]|uniref:Uncharacterized protein n=1 Tax=candidate division CPR2 bacterium GW2011_GWC2_39_10 TaxID=1618345 RepID=A0A0G0P9F6_UNCC2|nr:MAG: hypothetical protein UT18_C0007G0010 [candidate division CPR2 bacterium GW2011_GWC2_39_10]KKR35175.1 MAG: hypothetical protein UT66_C0012G0016 [candidate division CPR2 bacterium GW2011_GWC1_39_9]
MPNEEETTPEVEATDVVDTEEETTDAEETETEEA